MIKTVSIGWYHFLPLGTAQKLIGILCLDYDNIE